jgi:IS5 family transposase
VFRTVCDRPTLWEALLPPEALVMPAELTAVDCLLDDPRFFEPFRRWFDPLFGRPSIPMETYLRLMFLKYLAIIGELVDLAETTVEQWEQPQLSPVVRGGGRRS